ncbi:MAG TPA: septum formation family protein [Microbacteriaceae bacterium]|nr:septum formation family protein [Microbacteriaceae bacterium]
MSNPTDPGEQSFRWNLTPQHSETETETDAPVESIVEADPVVSTSFDAAQSAPDPAQPIAPPVAPPVAPVTAPVTTPAAAPRLPAGEAGFDGIGTTPATTPDRAVSTARLLWWVTGGLLALVVVVAAFFVGPRLFSGAGATPTPTQTPGATPSAQAGLGSAAWDDLAGGECLSDYTTPWANTFTVVDCAGPHTAQLVYRGTVPGDATEFPGEDAIAAQIPTLCTQAGVFDPAAASAIPNLQVEYTYPVTAEQWNAGERSFYCFASRADGEPLNASIQGPGPQ